MTLCDWCDKKAVYKIEYENRMGDLITEYACEEHYMEYCFNWNRAKLVSTLG